jgi:hypothetical protein
LRKIHHRLARLYDWCINVLLDRLCWVIRVLVDRMLLYRGWADNDARRSSVCPVGVGRALLIGKDHLDEYKERHEEAAEIKGEPSRNSSI